MSDEGFDKAVRESEQYRNEMTRRITLDNLIRTTQQRLKEITTDITMNVTMRDIETKRFVAVEKELIRLRDDHILPSKKDESSSSQQLQPSLESVIY